MVECYDLYEKSLSRVVSKTQKGGIAIISSDRGDKTNKENQKHHQDLLSVFVVLDFLDQLKYKVLIVKLEPHLIKKRNLLQFHLVKWAKNYLKEPYLNLDKKVD
jgi:hypothetical protein